MGIVGEDLVDHHETRVDRGSVAGEDSAVDRRGEDEAAMLPQAGKGVGPGRIVRLEIRPRDRDETPAGAQPRERGGDMPICGVRHRAIDVGERREGRVHQHDAGRYRHIEAIVDLRGVEAMDARSRKQQSEKVGSGLSVFVEAERRSLEFSEDSEQPSPRGWLKDEIIRRKRGSGAGSEAQCDRRRELLQGLALGGATGVGRKQRRDLCEDRQ